MRAPEAISAAYIRLLINPAHDTDVNHLTHIRRTNRKTVRHDIRSACHMYDDKYCIIICKGSLDLCAQG